MKKFLITLLAGFMLSSTLSFAQEDPFKKFGIPEKFRNYREKGFELGVIPFARMKNGKKIYFLSKGWYLGEKLSCKIIEVYRVKFIGGLLLPKENPCEYWFDINEDSKFEGHEKFRDKAEKGDFNCDVERFSPPPVFYEKKLPSGYSFLA